MISLPYNAPVKIHVINRRWVIRDPQNREVIEISLNSNSIDNWKRLTWVSNFLQDLMNGKKSVSYNPQTKGYEIMSHAEAPEPGQVVAVPGTLAAAEQADMERQLVEMNGKPTVMDKIQEAVVQTAATVVAVVKRGRGRPRKK